MNNTGQQLREARSRLGYSIKEVSERIHIRAEYLGEIEENTFNIPLNTVYVRGFVRLYAKFLKLDPDEIVDSFNKRNAQMEFSTEVSEERESLGMLIQPGKDAHGDDSIEGNTASIFERYRNEDDEDRPPWMLPAIIAVAVVVLFAAVFYIKVTYFPNQPKSVPGQIDEPQDPQGGESGLSVESINENLIGLVAKAPVYIYVTQTTNDEILFSGRLDTNERRTIVREGEISIACDKSENLIVEKGGIPVDLKGTTGRAKFLIN